LKSLNNEVTSETLVKLVDSAEQARENSYSPYSKFRVGCALLTKDGNIIKGANIENASYGLTICAERSALVTAASAGERNLPLAVVTTDMDYAVTPCGACRQFLHEFQVKHVVMSTVNRKLVYCPLSYLLPLGPDLEHLKK
jgi:cytidine deaminase